MDILFTAPPNSLLFLYKAVYLSFVISRTCLWFVIARVSQISIPLPFPNKLIFAGKRTGYIIFKVDNTDNSKSPLAFLITLKHNMSKIKTPIPCVYAPPLSQNLPHFSKQQPYFSSRKSQKNLESSMTPFFLSQSTSPNPTCSTFKIYSESNYPLPPSLLLPALKPPLLLTCISLLLVSQCHSCSPYSLLSNSAARTIRKKVSSII